MTNDLETIYAPPQATAASPPDPKLRRAARLFAAFFVAHVVAPNVLAFAAPIVGFSLGPSVNARMLIRVVLRANGVVSTVTLLAAAVFLFRLLRHATDVIRPVRVAAQVAAVARVLLACVITVEGFWHFSEHRSEWVSWGNSASDTLHTFAVVTLVRHMAANRSLAGRKHLSTLVLLFIIVNAILLIPVQSTIYMLVAAAVGLLTWIGILTVVLLMPRTPA
jgi:hypothetical protein